MNRHGIVLRAVAIVFLAAAITATAASAQEVPGLTFDVSITTGDSTEVVTQFGRGWITRNQARMDFRASGDAAAPIPGTQGITGIPGITGRNTTVLVPNSDSAAAVTMIDHDAKKVLYTSKLTEGLREGMAFLPEQPRIKFSVTNIVVDSLGAGETISGFTTKRFRLAADLTIEIAIMGESMSQTMHILSEGDYAEELSEYADPLHGSRAFQSLTGGMPWIDSTAASELSKFARVTPRGLPLRQTERFTGSPEAGLPGAVTTTLANIKREMLSPSVFAIPEGYTELELPAGPPMAPPSN